MVSVNLKPVFVDGIILGQVAGWKHIGQFCNAIGTIPSCCHFVIDSVVPGCYRAVAYASDRTDGADGDSVSTSIIVAGEESTTLNLKLPKKEE